MTELSRRQLTTSVILLLIFIFSALSFMGWKGWALYQQYRHLETSQAEYVDVRLDAQTAITGVVRQLETIKFEKIVEPKMLTQLRGEFSNLKNKNGDSFGWTNERIDWLDSHVLTYAEQRQVIQQQLLLWQQLREQIITSLAASASVRKAALQVSLNQWVLLADSIEQNRLVNSPEQRAADWAAASAELFGQAGAELSEHKRRFDSLTEFSMLYISWLEHQVGWDEFLGQQLDEFANTSLQIVTDISAQHQRSRAQMKDFETIISQGGVLFAAGLGLVVLWLIVLPFRVYYRFQQVEVKLAADSAENEIDRVAEALNSELEAADNTSPQEHDSSMEVELLRVNDELQRKAKEQEQKLSTLENESVQTQIKIDELVTENKALTQQVKHDFKQMELLQEMSATYGFEVEMSIAVEIEDLARDIVKAGIPESLQEINKVDFGTIQTEIEQWLVSPEKMLKLNYRRKTDGHNEHWRSAIEIREQTDEVIKVAGLHGCIEGEFQQSSEMKKYKQVYNKLRKSYQLLMQDNKSIVERNQELYSKIDGLQAQLKDSQSLVSLPIDNQEVMLRSIPANNEEWLPEVIDVGILQQQVADVEMAAMMLTVVPDWLQQGQEQLSLSLDNQDIESAQQALDGLLAQAEWIGANELLDSCQALQMALVDKEVDHQFTLNVLNKSCQRLTQTLAAI